MTGRWEPRARDAVARTLATDPEQLELVPLALREKRETYLCAAPGARVVAKCFAEPEVAAASAHALQLAGGRHGPLLVPRCLHYDAERQVVVQDHLPGGPLIPLLEGEGAPAVVVRAARALAELHRLPGRFEARRPRAELVARACAAVLTVPPPDGERAAAALDWAMRRLEGLPRMEHVVCHGDFGWAQLLDCNGAVGVVDFDRAVEAEPAFDVGNLVAQLFRRRGSSGRALAAPLIDEYERRTGWAVRELVLPYAALVLVRKLGRLHTGRQPELHVALAALDEARRDR
jgi:aminoglycoside phosphotransferase (APT) family kinase protein